MLLLFSTPINANNYQRAGEAGLLQQMRTEQLRAQKTLSNLGETPPEQNEQLIELQKQIYRLVPDAQRGQLKEDYPELHKRLNR